ncbi:Putative PD-(D/E)XK family member [Tessaracoccus oleiagri]|uniref:Putative PD-(D/E)XK family member n=2 Tax=Tessaracoccus oleiagri TaxID=686624 RepID=A0A1G9I0C2_9ACTN|nr:Putative PD-(D/E)XK family member [Tessaracoccus oleiagri]
MFAALDQHGVKNLLVPIPSNQLPLHEDLGSRGAHLVATNVLVDGSAQQYASLRCVEQDLDLVFDRLASDVVTRVFEQNLEPLDACRRSLDDWRALLRKSSSLAASQVVGLHAELELLRRLGEADPSAAMAWWVGPRHAVHDFVNGPRALEVKGTSTREGQFIAIHGLDQLDRGTLAELHLAVVRCRESSMGASLDDRIRALIDLGFPRSLLVERVAEAGYLFESTPGGATYEINDIRYWPVDDEFPGLRRTQMPTHLQKGVSGVQYHLSLEALPEPLSESEVKGLFQRWNTL